VADVDAEGVDTDNLLLNGSMEDGFYWRYPNHYVAHNWARWWIDGTILPEFDSTRESRPHYDGEKAQVYFKWGDSYTAGIYQVVDNVMPCAYYQLDVWARNHSVEDALPHARAGLDPDGTQLTKDDKSGAVKYGLPPRTAWSWEQTNLSVWEQLSVSVEAKTDRLTAILYASPEPRRDQVHFYDTYWDAARLYQLPYPVERLPAPASEAPSAFISNVTTRRMGSDLVVEWNTAAPAPTQVWYTVRTPAEPVTASATLSHTLHMPMLARTKSLTSFESVTPVDTSVVTHYIAVIGGMESGQTVTLAVLVRRSDGTACQTEVSERVRVEIN
ncbi:MAG: hypothetical protein ACP5JG_17910, partial [Anaerolineae bacterium]